MEIAEPLGVLASTLFVVSYVPQVTKLLSSSETPSLLMFAVQLVSGGLWIAYGHILSLTSILVFGVLSTTFRIAVLVLVLCRRRRDAEDYILLAGGGDLPVSVWSEFARRVPIMSSVLVVSDATTDVHAKKEVERAAARGLILSGCRPVLGTVKDIRRFSCVWFNGGNADVLIANMRKEGVGVEELKRISTSGILGGTSAGVETIRRFGMLPFHVSVHGKASNDITLHDGSCVVLSGNRLTSLSGVVVLRSTRV